MPSRDLSELYNKHRGKPGVIVGNGASLCFEDISKLNDLTTVSCNSKIWTPHMYSGGALIPNPFKPKYVVFSEEQTYFEPTRKDCGIIYAENSCNLKDFAALMPEYDFYKFRVKRTFLNQSFALAEHPNWTKNLKSVVAGISGDHNKEFNMVFGGMSTAVAITFWMGFNPIYLVAFDGGAVDNRYHFWAKPGEQNSLYANNSMTMQRTFTGQTRYLHICKEVYKTCGVEFFCATKDSKYAKVLGYSALP